jgi:hypothetical protein
MFWLAVGAISIVLVAFMVYLYAVILPSLLHLRVANLKEENKSLLLENANLKTKNDDLLIKSGSLQLSLETELTKVAELQAQANIVEKIKKESLEEIAKYSKKYDDQTKQIEFYQELMSPAVEQELQCFNVNVKYSKKYVDYGINLVLDEKNETGQKYDVEFRLLSGKDNVDLTTKQPEELAPDAIRNISIKNSIRLTGKIKHNNKLKGLKVLDVRVFNKSKKLAAQCWKVF